MPITISSNSVTLPSNDVITDEGCVANFGIMFGDGPQITVATTDITGYPFRATRVWIQKNIDVSIGGVAVADRGVTWKHRYTGIYALHLQYRQASGGDTWTVHSVTKNGDLNVVGTTARMGGEDNHTESFHLMYVCDDTDAYYQIRSWTQSGTKTMGHTASYPDNDNTPYQWTDAHSSAFSSNMIYRSDRGQGNGTMEGRILDINIYRVSPL